MRVKYILVVDDERAIREMMLFALRRHGFQAGEAEDAEGARLSIAEKRPDLVLLDWMLPTMTGLDLARTLKGARSTSAIPIIMVTAREEEQDRVTALDCGADDYLTKPFSTRELLARINAVLRRSRDESNRRSSEASGLVLDHARQRVAAGEQSLQLSPIDFRLLEFLMTHPERVHNRTELLHQVWGGIDHAEKRTVDVQIRRLRKVLEACEYDRFIQTVYGSGYRFSMRAE